MPFSASAIFGAADATPVMASGRPTITRGLAFSTIFYCHEDNSNIDANSAMAPELFGFF
jgi:hypothetical protein